MAIKRLSWTSSTSVLLGVLGLACTAGADRADWRDSTLTVHLMAADEWLFSPAQADEPMFLLFLPLVQQGPNGEIEGRLARSWEHSDDYRKWTVHLRTDVRWHDGVPFTAHDVAFTADLLTHPGGIDDRPLSPASRTAEQRPIAKRSRRYAYRAGDDCRGAEIGRLCNRARG